MSRTKQETTDMAQHFKVAIIGVGFGGIAMTIRLLPQIMKITQKLAETWIKLSVKNQNVTQKLIPNYIMGCKRILTSNQYFPTFNRSNVNQFNRQLQEMFHDTVWQAGCINWYQQDGGENFALWSAYT